MTQMLYVGNMPPETTQEQISTLFSEVGVVTKVNLIIDRQTGSFKGFGFVEMATEESGKEAISRFNGYKIAEYVLKVNKARPREDRS